jgi:hypothetical protein
VPLPERCRRGLNRHKTAYQLRIAKRPPHPRSLRSLDLSPHAGRGEASEPVLAARWRPSYRHGLSASLPKIKAKGGGAPKSAVHWSRICGCGARLAIGALAFRRSTAVLTEVSRPRLFDFRPGFLGRGSRRRYPLCAYPSPAEAPRAPAVIPADMMPQGRPGAVCETARRHRTRPASSDRIRNAPFDGRVGCSVTATVIAVKDE